MRIFVSFQFSPEKRVPVGVLSDFGRDTVFEPVSKPPIARGRDALVASKEDDSFHSDAARAPRPRVLQLTPLNTMLHFFRVASIRDDHLKNFGFLMDAAGNWSLAPFYDFTWSEGPNGWQTLSVAGEGANPTESDLDRLREEVLSH